MVSAVCMVGLLATIVVAALVTTNAVENRDQRLLAEAERVRVRLQDRLEGVTDVALATRNGLMRRPDFDAEVFNDLAALSEREDLLDEALAISFVRRVPGSAVPSYEAGQRADGRDGFSVTPPSTDAGDRYVVELISPVEGNEGAIGFDLGSNPVRLTALEAARDRGEAAATAPISLVQDEDARAILLLLPMYATTDIPVTAPARRRHHTGFVSVVVRVDPLVEEVLGPASPLQLTMYDVGDTAGPPADELREDARLHGRPSGADGLRTELDLNVGGRRWRMVATPTERFDASLGMLPLLLPVIVLLVTALVAVLVAGTTAARDRAERLIAARTAELRRLIDFAPDATLVVDRDGLITSASRRTLAVLGHEPEELIGRRVEDLVPHALRDSHVPLRHAYTSEHRAAGAMATAREVHAVHADGHEVLVEVTLNPMPPPPDDPGAVRVIASVRDVTAQREAARRAAELNEQKSVFLRTVSHELRTPLTAIDGFVDVLLQMADDLSPQQHRDFLERIGRNSAQLQRLILEIIEFARLDRDRLTVHTEPTDLGELVEEVTAQLTPVLRDHEVAVAVDDDVLTEIDAAAMTRVLTNLLTNAARYSPVGTTISVTVSADGAAAVLAIEDEGPGIPEEDRARVFERFWRGSGTHVVRQTGTGIGLAVVAELTTLHGGEVRIADAAGGGARVEVRLPRSPSDRRLTDHATSGDPGGSTSAGG